MLPRLLKTIFSANLAVRMRTSWLVPLMFLMTSDVTNWEEISLINDPKKLPRCMCPRGQRLLDTT